MLKKTSSKQTIEIELHSFITKEQYLKLIAYLKKVGEYHGRDEQVTYYFSGKHDLRVQKNSKGAKIWSKGGKLHDVERKEIEVRVERDDFDKLHNLMIMLGYKVDIEWYRTRHTFTWRGVLVSVDYTKGYGHIIEVEKKTEGVRRQEIKKLLASRLEELGVALTPREEFEKQYQYYKKHWKTLI